MKNGLSQPYDLDESTFVFRGIRSNFSILFHFAMKFMKTYRMSPDGTPHNAGSHLGIFRLPLSHKKVARLIWVNNLLGTKSIYSIEVSGIYLYISKAMRNTL